MRCNKLFKYANLLALGILMLSSSLTFPTQTLKTPTDSDIITRSTQEQKLAKMAALTQQPIADTASIPTPITPRRSTTSFVISISGRSTPIFTTGSLATNPGTRVAFYDNQFLFAHSSGPFSELGTVSSFQIIRNSAVENYRIVKKTTYCDYSNAAQYGPQYNCKNYTEPKLPTRGFGYAGNYYEAGAFGYDLVLMTCAGSTLPNQDATHRLLAYAIRV